MIQGYYSAASSLAAAAQHQDVISHNLAHATVPGYRQRGLAFSAFIPNADGDSPGQVQGTQISQEYTVFRAGDFQKTDSALEVALRGDGFFVLQSANGPVYTRNGTFELSATGQLQSRSGLPVSGTGGTITIPPQAANITIGPDGTVSADGANIGQLRVVNFADASRLRRIGPTLFESDGAQPGPSQAQVVQGFRESGNVNVVQEMIALIAGSRHYEAASRALRTLSETLQLRTQPQQT